MSGPELHPVGGAPAPEDAHLREVRVGSEELLKGRFLHAFRDTVRLPDGHEATREYVLHPGAVMVIAELADGVGSSRVDLQACKLEYSIVSPK